MNLKKTLCVIFVLSLLIMTFSACSDGKVEAANDDEVIKLRLAHFFPSTHPAEKVLIKNWIDEINEATDGKVEIESYPGETLLKANNIYNGVVKGNADIGLSCFSYTSGRFPVLEVFELPGVVYKNSKVASMVAWEGIKELQPEEVQDTKLLMVIATGPGHLFTKEPVESIEDLQQMQIRATGISAEALTALGASPVGISQAEAYESLQKGIVQGNLSPIEVLKGWKQAEVTDYITETPFLYNTLFFITMNLEKWNSLSKDLQETILEVTQEVHEEKGIGLWDSQNEDAMDYVLNEEGMEMLTLSDEEKERWINKVSGLHDEYKKKLDELGIDKDVIGTVKDLADKYNDIY